MMSHMLLHVLSATMEIEGEGVVCVCRTRSVQETMEGERRQRNRTYLCVLKVFILKDCVLVHVGKGNSGLHIEAVIKAFEAFNSAGDYTFQ